MYIVYVCVHSHSLKERHPVSVFRVLIEGQRIKNETDTDQTVIWINDQKFKVNIQIKSFLINQSLKKTVKI